MCLPLKLKKAAVKQPLPPKTAIFRRKLTFSGHTRRIFNANDPIFLYFLELNVPTRKKEKNSGGAAATADNRNLPPKYFLCHFSPN